MNRTLFDACLPAAESRVSRRCGSNDSVSPRFNASAGALPPPCGAFVTARNVLASAQDALHHRVVLDPSRVVLEAHRSSRRAPTVAHR